MSEYDRRLSLQIDAAHDELNRLAGSRGLRAILRRCWVQATLRLLELRIPCGY